MLRVIGLIVLGIGVMCVLAFALLTDDPLYSDKPYDEDDPE